MWCVTLILISVASCNTEVFELNTVELPSTSPSRIIGGTNTTILKYPFIVQVIYNAQFLCGGSLLTSRHVLSAGHCFVDQNGYLLEASRYAIRMGTSFLNTGGSLHRVSAIILHEGYNVPARNNDIAVVVMSSAAVQSSSVAFASIPILGQVVPDNSSVTAIGWGVIHPNGLVASPVLNEVTVHKINQTTCRARYLRLQNESGYAYPVTDGMICAGLLNVGGKDACRGDSGGPLIYDNAVVGVTSWGESCAEPLYPGVSARVAYYTDWINLTVTRFNAASVSRVGAMTLLTPILFLILSA